LKILLSVIVFTVFLLNVHISLENVGGLTLPVLKVGEAKASGPVCFHNAEQMAGSMTNFCSGVQCIVAPGYRGSEMYQCGGATLK
jgi:hypothetical protein